MADTIAPLIPVTSRCAVWRRAAVVDGDAGTTTRPGKASPAVSGQHARDMTAEEYAAALQVAGYRRQSLMRLGR
jgi:hypothetical protein